MSAPYFAIRYHMGFSGSEDKGSVGKAFQMFPLAFALSVADMEATYFLEGGELTLSADLCERTNGRSVIARCSLSKNLVEFRL